MRGFGWVAVITIGCSFASPVLAGEAPLIQSLAIEGTRRQLRLDTRAGEAFDLARVEHDVRRLWVTGWFDDIQVESAETTRGISLKFLLVEKPRLRLRRVRFEPGHERRAINLKKGVPVDALLAARVATELRHHLVEEGYPDAKVDAAIVPAGFQRADLHLKVERGQPYSVESVQFRGNLGLAPKELRKALNATRAVRILPSLGPLWHGWRLLAPYSQQALDSDLERLRSLYISRGYFDARVKLDRVEFARDKATITIGVDSGHRYRVQKLEPNIVGTNSNLSRKIRENEFAPALCKCLRNARAESERRGELAFSPHLEIQPSAEQEPLGEAAAPALPQTPVTLAVKFEPGSSYRVGRIEFSGNHALGDSTLRRALVLREGDVFDQRRLRKSLARLNHSAVIEPVAPADVRVNVTSESGVVNLTIPVKEKKRGFWALSGPLAPVGELMPFQFSIGSRLPAWSRGPFEFSTYFATVSLAAWPAALGGIVSPIGWRPLFALQRPHVPGQRWTSGFFIAPQLGWRGTAAGYGLNQLSDVAHSVINPQSIPPPDIAAPVAWRTAKAADSAPPIPLGVLQCPEPKPRLSWLRSAGSMGLDLAMSWLLSGKTL